MKPNLYTRWIGANALAELVGLGGTLALAAWIFTRPGGPTGAAGILLAFGLAVASGVVEATIVGLAQWWAMHPWFPAIQKKAWWFGTLVGALLAYVLGYLPSTLMDLEAEASSTATVAEPPQALVFLLAAALGAVGGAVLSFAQWLVLRRKVQGASLWIPANMLAWTAGMPLIFWGIDLAQRAPTLPLTVLIVAAFLLLAGALVGAIHGAFLTRLAVKNLSQSKSERTTISIGNG